MRAPTQIAICYRQQPCQTPRTALYVRLPQPESDKLDRAAEALATNKKTLVTTLVAPLRRPRLPRRPPELGRALRARLAAPRPRRVTSTCPTTGMAVGHHAFTPGAAPDVLTPAQAAELLQVAEAEISRSPRPGRSPAAGSATHWRFSRPALIAWLARPRAARRRLSGDSRSAAERTRVPPPGS